MRSETKTAKQWAKEFYDRMDHCERHGASAEVGASEIFELVIKDAIDNAIQSSE